jgi:hypothetical protein
MAEHSEPLLGEIRHVHRRVLNLFRPLESCQDDFERIERVSVICDEIRQLLTAEHCVLYPLLEDAATEAGPTTTAARLRQASVLSLVERLETVSPEEADFDVLARHTYHSLREYVCANERELFPLVSQLPVTSLHDADRRLRDLRERMAEH